LPVKNADKILVVNEGKLVEEGTHEELMQTNGVYQHLVQIYQQQHRDDESKIGK
jgi:ABC-type multidrug transport system fused ATPase/permease subunit